MLKCDDGRQISVYGVVRNIDNKYWIMVEDIQGLGAEAQAEIDRGIAEQKKKEEDDIVREKAAVTKMQKEKQEREIQRQKEKQEQEIKRQKEEEEGKVQRDNAKKESDTKRTKQLAMKAKETELAQALKPLYQARKDLIQEFPVPGQNGKRVGQILSELELARSATKDRFQIEAIQTNIRQIKEIQASLGVSKAVQTMMDIQDKLAQVDGAAINPTLPNWGMQNGRTTFKSVATKNTIKAGLQKDLAALKKYKEGIENLDKQIADIQKQYEEKE